MYLQCRYVERKACEPKIQRWGNSLALRIPRSFAADARVEDGSIVDLSIDDGSLVVRPIRHKKYELRELLRRIEPESIHEEIDTGGPVGKEML